MLAAFVTQEGKKSFLHVYAYADGYLIDALGIKSEEDYLKHARGSRSRKIDAEVCSENDLFTKTGTKEGYPAYEVNRWGLVMDDSFIAYAKARAEKLIRVEPNRYQLSFLSERKMTKKPNQALEPTEPSTRG